MGWGAPQSGLVVGRLWGLQGIPRRLRTWQCGRAKGPGEAESCPTPFSDGYTAIPLVPCRALWFPIYRGSNHQALEHVPGV